MTRTTILALFLAVTAPTLSAQTVESGFDWLSCADFGGLHGFSENCGADTNFYPSLSKVKKTEPHANINFEIPRP
ncbi:MAG TPA: hypothetical protein VHN74_19815 [Candidatus Angelobacter sp.]|nr:hypothetical protein [Candidatus Angelobacter sp.]